MAERIVIEGNLARHERVEVVYEAPLAGLTPFLTTRLATTLPVLPQRPVRYIHFDPEAGRGLLIVETSPRKHHIQVRHSGGRYTDDATRRDRDGLSRFEVQLPYQYFAYGFTMRTAGNSLVDFTVDRSFLFWAKDPIRDGATNYVWIAPVPNVDSNGSICWGSTNSDSRSLSARIDDLVNNFFTTVFNEDLGHRTPFGTSLTEWERASQGDPLAWREWDFWNDHNPMEAKDIPDHMNAAPPTNIAELNPAHINLPELPTNFTVARAQEWLSNLDPGAHRRILAALATVPAPEPEEAEA